MPYVLISTQVRLECGPTVVGDEWSDPELMKYLGAELIRSLGNNFLEYRTKLCPREALDRLARRGFRVVAMTGVGQTCVWTLYQPDRKEEINSVNNQGS